MSNLIIIDVSITNKTSEKIYMSTNWVKQINSKVYKSAHKRLKLLKDINSKKVYILTIFISF